MKTLQALRRHLSLHRDLLNEEAGQGSVLLSATEHPVVPEHLFFHFHRVIGSVFHI